MESFLLEYFTFRGNKGKSGEINDAHLTIARINLSLWTKRKGRGRERERERERRALKWSIKGNR
jgi:hypothetical protein